MRKKLVIFRLAVCCAAAVFFLKRPLELRFFGPINCFRKAYFLQDFLIVAVVFILAAFIFSRFRKLCVPGSVNLFKPIKEKHLLVGIFILCLFFGLGINLLFTDGIPTISDDLSYINQAKIFSSGHLYASAPISKAHFCSLMDVVKDGKWYSRYPPGFPLVLALALLVKLPLQAVSPIFGGLSLIIIYLLGKELYGRRIAVYALLLGILSPYFLIFNSLVISENFSLFFTLGFIFCFVRMIKNGGRAYPLLSGLSLGLVFITRPYAALLAGLPFFGYLVYLCIRRDKGILEKVILFAVGFVAVSWVLPWYNWKLTGDPFTTTFNLSEDMKDDYPGFHKINGFAWGPRLAWDGVRANAVLFNRFLFGWPVSMIFIFTYLFFIRRNKWDILLLSLFLFLIAGYFPYWVITVRYWHAALPALLFLTARGMVKAPLLLERIGVSRRTGKSWVVIFAAICFLHGVFFWYPVLYKEARAAYSSGRGRIPGVVEKSGIHNAVVFIKPVREHLPVFPAEKNAGETYPYITTADFRFLNTCATGLIKNSPYLDSDVVYAVDLGEKNSRVMDYYRGRGFYIYEFNADSGVDRLYEVRQD